MVMTVSDEEKNMAVVFYGGAMDVHVMPLCKLTLSAYEEVTGPRADEIADLLNALALTPRAPADVDITDTEMMSLTSRLLHRAKSMYDNQDENVNHDDVDDVTPKVSILYPVKWWTWLTSPRCIRVQEPSGTTTYHDPSTHGYLRDMDMYSECDWLRVDHASAAPFLEARAKRHAQHDCMMRRLDMLVRPDRIELDNAAARRRTDLE